MGSDSAFGESFYTNKDNALDNKELENLASSIIDKRGDLTLVQKVYNVDDVSFPRGPQFVHYIVSLKKEE